MKRTITMLLCAPLWLSGCAPKPMVVSTNEPARDNAAIQSYKQSVQSTVKANYSIAGWKAEQACYANGYFRFNGIEKGYSLPECASDAQQYYDEITLAIEQEKRAAEMKEAEAKKAEEMARQESQEAMNSDNNEPSNVIDVDTIAAVMHQSYLFGGPAAMFMVEKECWSGAKGVDDAESCFIHSLTGVLIEAAYSNANGVMPAPNYNSGIASQRVKDKLAKMKLTKEQIKKVNKDVGDNAARILVGLANAGMR